VMPGGKSRLVFSAKDLKPSIVRFFKYTAKNQIQKTPQSKAPKPFP